MRNPDVDTISRPRRSANMRRIKSKDTKPEMAVRRLIHGLGYRYRLHCHDLPGKPDLAFANRRKAIFVHGCFWHQHGSCVDSHIPKSRRAYWVPKLQNNRKRDIENYHRLRDLKWKYLVLWECEMENPKSLKKKIEKFLSP
ncbi:MAG: very short patch repair endonuclease [Terriglobia bacterium]